MTDLSPTPAARGINRRGLLKAGAWAAPVVVLAVAVPAAAASPGLNQIPPPTGVANVPGDRLTGRLALWNDNSHGTPGPIGWNGQIDNKYVQASDPATASVPFVVAVLVPGATQCQTLRLDVASIAKSKSFDMPNVLSGADVMTKGTYTFRLAVALRPAGSLGRTYTFGGISARW